MRFTDQTIFISGAASGIGAAMAREFAAEGGFVWVADLDPEQGEAVATEIGGAYVSCDVSQHEGVAQVFAELFGQRQLDVLVNNAGISHIGTLTTTEEADFDRIFQVNVKGVYNCLHAAVPHFIEQGKGVILNMASVASKVGLPDRFAYSMSKGAVHNMTLSVARDYVDQGIRCNCICPARVHTPFVDAYLKKNYPGQEQEWFEKLSAAQPIGRMARPEEIAKLATYLCSEDAGFVTGVAWDIDGGFMNIR